MSGSYVLRRVDWVSILVFALLVGIGWLNIYSSTFSETDTSLLDFSQLYGKQLMFIGISLVLIIVVMALDANFYERFSSIFYIISILLLIGLFLFGKTIAGATSWYDLGFFNLQPSELAKSATALALAKYLSDIQTDIKRRKDQWMSLLIFILPALLIIPQPDPGSALVFFALIFVLFREGLPLWYLAVAFIGILIFITTLMFGTVWVAIGLALLVAIFYLLKKPSIRLPLLPVLGVYLLTMVISLSVNFVFENVFEQRHRDRFNILLGKDVDDQGIGYNTAQSVITIGSGGLAGKGFLQGDRTQGDFVPEQQTDYIFSTVGEEWGFLGSSFVIFLFVAFLIRLLYIADRQKSVFSQVFAYATVAIFFFHFTINIGMVIGILPTIGIPLPFFSYGGSSLWGFTVLLFIMIRLDADRIYEW